MSITTEPKHLGWLTHVGETLVTSDGHQVQVWELTATADPNVWSHWAKHLRLHYCSDDLIDILKNGTPYASSRSDFLREMIFPDAITAPGPAIRSGDFCEILVADMLEHKFKFVVPRTRYADKTVRNESTKGSDVIGFKVDSIDRPNPEDVLAIFEVKGKLTGRTTTPPGRLQDAINDSAKDEKRKGESLLAMKRRLLQQNKISEAKLVERFQNPIDLPYRYSPGASAVLTSSCWMPEEALNSTCNGHPDADLLTLVVIKADDFIEILTSLYDLAANEA
jgi:hypothetical protein